MRNNYSLLTRCIVALLVVLFSATAAMAQSAGFNSSYAVFSINGGADAYYCMPSNTSCGPNPALDGASLGSFAIGTGQFVRTLITFGNQQRIFGKLSLRNSTGNTGFYNSHFLNIK